MRPVFYANTGDFRPQWGFVPWYPRLRHNLRRLVAVLRELVMAEVGISKGLGGAERPRIFCRVVFHRGRFWNLVEGGCFPPGWEGGSILFFWRGAWKCRRTEDARQGFFFDLHTYSNRREAEAWLAPPCESCREPLAIGAWPFCASPRNPEGHARGSYGWHFGGGA